jgi:arylsulfatase A-like enzyme
MKLFDPSPLLLVIAAVAMSACGGDDPQATTASEPRSELGTMVSTRIVDEVLARADSWKRIEGTASVGILTTPGDYRVDAGDLPAVLMPPPCTVSFQVPALDVAQDSLSLRLAAGVDAMVFDAIDEYKGAGQPALFGFEVSLGGEVLFETEIEARQGQERTERSWKRPSGANAVGAGVLRKGRITCSPGDVITLRTWQKAGPKAPTENWRIGFGGLRIERDLYVDREPSSPTQPNVILIVQDTLRYDRTSVGGYGLPTTPALERLAGSGLSFDEAYAASSWTWPSTAAILTGRTPEVNGVTGRDSCYLASGNETLAEALQRRGYTTGAFTRNPLIVSEKNFDQGFETFDDSHRFQKTGTLLPKIMDWLEQRGDERFFLYLHLVDSHGPLTPLASEVERLGFPPIIKTADGQRVTELRESLLHGAGYNRKLERIEYVAPAELAEMNRLYDASVASGDTYLAKIMDWVESQGLGDETVIAFTSDHGEEWLDHGHLEHAHSLYSELVRVPLVIAGPGIPKGEVASGPISNRRLAGSLAHIGQADLGDGVGSLGIEGYDLDERSTGPVFFSTRYALWNAQRDQQTYGIRIGDEVLHYCPTGRPFGVSKANAPPEGEWRLFNLADDPKELHDLAAERPKRARELRNQLLDSLLERAEAAQEVTGGLDVDAGAATMDMLGRIGYLGD